MTVRSSVPTDPSALDLLSAMRAGRLSPRDLMADTLDRIAASDVNAVVSLRVLSHGFSVVPWTGL